MSEKFIHLPDALGQQLNISRSEGRRLLCLGGVKDEDGELVTALDVPVDEFSGKELTVGKRRRVKL